jgi:hypothetical protein
MLSFEEIELGTVWRNIRTGLAFVVTGKEARIIGHDGWIKYQHQDMPELYFEADWKTFVTNYEEVR